MCALLIFLEDLASVCFFTYLSIHYLLIQGFYCVPDAGPVAGFQHRTRLVHALHTPVATEGVGESVGVEGIVREACMHEAPPSFWWEWIYNSLLKKHRRFRI